MRISYCRRGRGYSQLQYSEICRKFFKFPKGLFHKTDLLAMSNCPPTITLIILLFSIINEISEAQLWKLAFNKTQGEILTVLQNYFLVELICYNNSFFWHCLKDYDFFKSIQGKVNSSKISDPTMECCTMHEHAWAVHF